MTPGECFREAAEIWKEFMRQIDQHFGGTNKNFLGSSEAYRKCFELAILARAAEEDQRSEAQGPAKGGKQETAPCESSDHPTPEAAALADRLKDMWHRWKGIVDEHNFGDQLDGDFDTIAAAIAALRGKGKP